MMQLSADGKKKMLSMHLLRNPANPLLAMYSRDLKTYVYMETRTRLFTSAVFNLQKQNVT